MEDKERGEGKKQGVKERERERVVPNDSRGKLYRDRLNPNERVARLDSITLSVPSALTLVPELDLVGSTTSASFSSVAPRLTRNMALFCLALRNPPLTVPFRVFDSSIAGIVAFRSCNQ